MSPVLRDSVYLPHGREIVWLDPSALTQNETRAAYHYWNALRGERPWPARAEMKLRHIVSLMPHMALVKVLDGGADFEHRIVGDTMVRAFSVPIQNRRFSEIALDAPVLIEGSMILFGKVVSTGLPVAWQQRVLLDNLRIIASQTEMVLLPFGETTDAVDHIAAFGVQGRQSQSEG